eukprot:s6308_g2.t1
MAVAIVFLQRAMVHGTMATLLSVKTWPQRYVSLRNNPSGTVSGWDGDPGPAGHLVFQEREGHYLISTEQLPPIIQTMYLIHNKDREHSAAMSLLSNQKEEVRAREVAVLQAQMASERAASEATLDDTRREHGEACDVLNQEMQQQQATARNVLEERDRNHCNESGR